MMTLTIPDWAFGTGISIWLALVGATMVGCWLWGYKSGHADGREAERARRARSDTRPQPAVSWAAISADIQRRHALPPDDRAARWAAGVMRQVPGLRRRPRPAIEPVPAVPGTEAAQ